MAMFDILFLVVAFVGELSSAGIFYPFPGDIHCVNHVKFFVLLVIDLRHKALSSIEVFDALVSQFFFFLQFHDSGSQKLLLS